jgi:hypothetical protein
VEGSCEHGNETSGSIKCWEVAEYLHNWRLLKKDSAPWVIIIIIIIIIIIGINTMAMS